MEEKRNKLKRTSVACLSCREKKIKCELIENGFLRDISEEHNKCEHCRLKKINCVFDKKVLKRGPKLGLAKNLETDESCLSIKEKIIILEYKSKEVLKNVKHLREKFINNLY